ncbi:ferrochelatase [Denitrovibrio acetiphilus DSM 12809]|uniref:Ferrochelatase n=1 Tax=Denitrovibrio acetiphilus (strain DSM 12809 / NBRC 114555 / N2460) TaxID=522772 RepID=D4H7N0_DENA2|nr:ferrochelatase [Denitrovibrio acetiphilus]ADD68029.1 ferrochelatase [Denitrovibrio acetiphilus DSM 12809]
MKKDLLYVMYMGGPDSIEGIEEFLFNLFSDRTIIDFHIGGTLQTFIAKKIAKKRSKKVAPEYEKLGGCSPQLPYLKSLLEKIKPAYQASTGRELVTDIGMCYYHPYIEDSVKTHENTDYENIIVTTMYPQYSYTTTGVCFDRFYKAQNLKKEPKIIKHWHMNETYNKCIADRIMNAAQKLGKDISQCHIQFSAHSLPEYTVQKGDKYTLHIKEQMEKLAAMTNPRSYGLSYQSRTGPVKWVGPYTDKELERLTEEKTDNIIVVPISFVSDHIETLIELDEQYIPHVTEAGLNIVRIESLNDSDDFSDAFLNVITH